MLKQVQAEAAPLACSEAQQLRFLFQREALECDNMLALVALEGGTAVLNDRDPTLFDGKGRILRAVKHGAFVVVDNSSRPFAVAYADAAKAAKKRIGDREPLVAAARAHLKKVRDADTVRSLLYSCPVFFMVFLCCVM